MEWNVDQLSQDFLAYSRHKLIEEMWPRAIQAVRHLSEDQVWWRPNENSNSIGNVLLHLNGNIRQWLLGAVGGQNIRRNRDAEFFQRERIDSAALLAAVTETLHDVDKLFSHITAEDLQRRHVVQGHDVTGLQAIYHVVEHFSYHYGQILYAVKLLKDKDLGFYAHLTGTEHPKV